ncbi:MAG: hypothetical protein GY722_24360 [bacterium]|nr:hypothetical protein [bacterium]
MVAEFSDGILVGGSCEKGGLLLSEKAAEMIHEEFLEERPPLTAKGPFGFEMGDSWFCPRDGNKMEEGPQGIQCGACSRAISLRLVLHLVELHQHS